MNATRNVLAMLGLAATIAAPALAQRPGGQGQGRFGGPGLMGGPVQLLMAPPVQEELELSDEQIEQIEPIGETLRAAMMERLRDQGGGATNLSPEERRSRFEEISRELNHRSMEELKDVLSAEQMSRLQQIEIQQSGVLAFDQPAVTEKLKLSDEQAGKIETILTSYRQEARAIMEEGRDADDRREVMSRFFDLRQSSMDQAMAILDDSQKSAWDEMTGEPFAMGFGGRGGGNRPPSN